MQDDVIAVRDRELEFSYRRVPGMIPPPAQRLMSKRAGSTVVEIAGSHAIYESQPEAVAKLIEQAAKSII